MRSAMANSGSTKEALQQASDIFNNIQLGIYIYHLEDTKDDGSLRLVSANPATEKLTGVPVKNVIGKTLDENFPGLREKGIPKIYANVVRNQKAVEIEDLYYGDKRVIEGAFSIKAFPLPNNHVGVSFENITDRKKAEKELQISEEMHRRLIETMNDGFAILDDSGIITYANSKLCRMMGYERNDLVDHPTVDFLDKADIENLQKHTSSRAKKGSQPYEVEWVRKDGSKIPTIVSPSPIFNSTGDFTGSMAVLTDISELKKIESELIKQNLELETALYKLKNMHTQLVISEKMASLGQITAGVAHEINNPINFIKGNIKPLKKDISEIISVISKYEAIIKTKGLVSKFSEIEVFKKEIDYTYLVDEVDSLFEGIEEGTGRTTEIIKSLRNFSRSEEDKFIKSDVHEGIDSTLVILNNLIKERITVHKDYCASSVIECLPGKLNQVFMNIFTNAIQAIEEKGKIFIKTSSDNKNLSIRIRDTGKGMTDAVLNHIFEPFFSTKDPGKGTGLGLSISHSIIEKHKGKIHVSSAPDKGTEFTIQLPMIHGKD